MSCGPHTSSSIAKLHLRSSMVEVNRTLSHLTELNAAINAMIEEIEHLRGERAAVVAWLRSESFIVEFSKKENLGRIMCDVAAETIERGDHRKEKA